MFESCVLALVSLGVVLYVQARVTAREIRYNRARCRQNPISDLIVRPNR